MCGIAGILAAPGAREEAGEGSTVLAMARALRHRGPDAQTSWVDPDGRCAFGHARLKVVDLHTGDQPMHAADGRCSVVFNGEIYNFRELRAELERDGATFRTHSDTEVLLAGWERWGEGVVDHLDGMFAFALWDAREGRLFLARDRAGQKPLFLWRDGGRLVFASEIKALRAAGLPTRVRDEAVQLYLAYGYVPGRSTMLDGVTRLLPGECAVVAPGGEPEVRRYWSLDWTPEALSSEESRAGTRERFLSAVEKRLVADVPLGALLSGGVDSTLVVGVMSQLMDRPVDTFSMGFEGASDYDETVWARRMAKRFGTHHTEFRLDPSGLDLLDDLVEIWDEPFGDSSAIPTSEVCRHTRGSVTVALCGDGGDELFVGYPRFMGAVVADRMPRALAGVGRWATRWLPHREDFRHPFRRAERFMAAADDDEAGRTLRWIGYLQGDPGELTPDGRRPLRTRREVEEYFRAILRERPGLSALRRALRLNWETYLPEDLLVKADRSSMMHSLELRAPFLDHHLAEFVARVPDRTLAGGGRLKRLLRDAFADVVPLEVFDRPKMGFGVPIPHWFRSAWRTRFEAEVLGPDALSREWVREEPVRRLWAEHQDGTVDHAHALWALFTLEAWLRRWL